MSLSDSNYVPNEPEDVDQYDPYTLYNAMLKLSWKFGESKWNPCWLIVLLSSIGTNHGLKEHADFDQYGSFTIPFKIITYPSHPASLVDLLDKLIELWH